MKHYFITYGDAKFEQSKQRISQEAQRLGFFDGVIPFSPENLPAEIKESPLMSVRRGGGLWLWKPYIILATLREMQDGDLLVYADAGCTLQQSKRWRWIVRKLKHYDMIVHRLSHRTYRWTRREIIDLFPDNPRHWTYKYQYHATTFALKKTSFTVQLIEEWLDIMLHHPEAIMDVTESERPSQHPYFIENRHDQAVFSALVYRHLPTGRILTIWDRTVGYDPYIRQAVRATRLVGDDIDTASPTFADYRFPFVQTLLKRPLYHLQNILWQLTHHTEERRIEKGDQ